MTYAESLKALESRSEEKIELGLDRVSAHLRELGDPQEKVPAVHVAGTNGKGSTCALLESVLRAAGYRTGLYTSPHLLDVRERIRLDGAMIPEADFARLMENSLRLESAKRLTYFELLTAVAFQYFAEQKLDVAVLETGLGGRLDATNVVEKPALTVLTSISFDHMAQLGGTIPEIAAEKAGIMKSGVPCVCAVADEEALAVIVAASLDRLAPLERVEPGSVQPVRSDWDDGLQLIRARGYGDIYLRLLGRQQVRNAETVLKCVELLKERFPKLGPGAVEIGFKNVSWPGRFDLRTVNAGGRDRKLILDGAHNREAARALGIALGDSPFTEATMIVGFLKDKDVAGILSDWRHILSRVIVTEPASPRALSGGEAARLVKEAAPAARVQSAANFAEALRLWGEDPMSRCAVAAGSFYLVADALRALGLADGRR